jgi:hypothetical protein
MSHLYPKSASSVFGVAKLNGNTSAADTSQAYHAALNSIAGLTTASDKMIYASGSNTYAVTGLTATARTLLDDGSTSVMRTTLGLGTGDSPAFTSVTVSGAISSSNQLATKAYVDASGGGGAAANDVNTILHMSTFA